MADFRLIHFMHLYNMNVRLYVIQLLGYLFCHTGALRGPLPRSSTSAVGHTGALRGPHLRSSMPPSSSRPSLQLHANPLKLPLTLLQVHADDKYTLWASAAVAAAAGLRLEKSTTVGRSLSGPVCAMLITVVLTNFGVLPAAGSHHMSNLQSVVVKLATPLLLLGADMRKIFRETRGLLSVFLLGTLSTLFGSAMAFLMFGKNLKTLGVAGDGWKIASALTAKNIGGGLNFMAVCSALNISPATIGMGLSVDNLLGVLYFPFISWLGYPYEQKKSLIGRMLVPDKMASSGNGGSAAVSDEEQVARYSTVIAVGLVIVAISEHIGRLVGFSPVAVSSLLTVTLATFAAPTMQPLVPAGDLLGKLLLLLFFGSIGNSSGTVAATLSTKGVAGLLGFDSILYAGHLVSILGIGRLLNIPMPDILIASNANIGNAATASALASAKGWQSRLLPALLVGTFGNSIGTFIGLLIAKMFANMSV